MSDRREAIEQAEQADKPECMEMVDRPDSKSADPTDEDQERAARLIGVHTPVRSQEGMFKFLDALSQLIADVRAETARECAAISTRYGGAFITSEIEARFLTTPAATPEPER